MCPDQLIPQEAVTAKDKLNSKPMDQQLLAGKILDAINAQEHITLRHRIAIKPAANGVAVNHPAEPTPKESLLSPHNSGTPPATEEIS